MKIKTDNKLSTNNIIQFTKAKNTMESNKRKKALDAILKKANAYYGD